MLHWFKKVKKPCDENATNEQDSTARRRANIHMFAHEALTLRGRRVNFPIWRGLCENGNSVFRTEACLTNEFNYVILMETYR